MLNFHGSWLVEETNNCTCPGFYGHEPHCGLEPVIHLQEVKGWARFLQEVKDGKYDHTVQTEEGTGK